MIVTVLLLVCVFGACKTAKPGNTASKGANTSSNAASTAGEVQSGGSAPGSTAADSSGTLLTTNVPDIGNITVTTSRKTEGSDSSAAGSASSKTQSSGNTGSKHTSSAAQSEDDGYISGYY